MSVAGISGTNLSQLSNIQRNYKQVQGEFQQLGQDLQSGSLLQAQTDFVTLSQSVAAQFGSNSAVTKTLSTVGQALQSGNLQAAQQSFAALPPGVSGSGSSSASSSVSQHHHSGGSGNKFAQMLGQVGQALQSGHLSAAQTAFSTVQQLWQSISPNALSASSANSQMTNTTGTGLNVTV
jgi:soluble cytochrome b562